MRHRLRGSAVLATVELALLVAAAIADAGASAPSSTAAGAARGGTFRYDSRSDFDYIDPQLAYFSHSWQMEDAVQLHLLGFPDKEGAAGGRLRAEAAVGLPTVSRDGKTYTFKVRPGFRFSNGTPVTAASFAESLNRALDPKLQSPAASFIEDVAGAKAVLDRKATKATGVVAKGQTLTVKLTKVAPDFLARMTMQFFPAIPVGLPHIAEGVQAPMVSAGPYHLKEWVQSRTALAVRNPYWNNAKEPWKSLQRPANVDAIRWTFGNSLDATKLRIDKNETDFGNVPPGTYAGIVQEHGLNRSRFFVRKSLTFWYLNLNREQSLFKNNTKLAQAVGYALDRPQMVRQHGFLGGGRTDQILPPGMPGYKDWSIYPLGGVNAAALAKAKSLANGNLRGGKATFYSFNTSFGPTVAQVVQFNLKQIGLDAEIKLYDRVVETEKGGTRGEPFDLLLNGWGADYPDPNNFINVLLDGTNIQATNNQNLSYFNDPSFNRRMAQAAVMSGDKRLAAYAALDRDLSRAGAVLGYVNTNGRYYVSQSTGCFAVPPVQGSIELVAVCKR